jgi:hypothetical protein
MACTEAARATGPHGQWGEIATPQSAARSATWPWRQIRIEDEINRKVGEYQSLLLINSVIFTLLSSAMPPRNSTSASIVW